MGVNEKLLRFDVTQLILYVESTRSDDGGYCFYRLNESNAADTFYAVYVLSALHRPVPEPELTADFLQQCQCSDGSFQSIYLADYVLRGLDLLGVPPLFDQDSFLHHQLKRLLRIVSQPCYELSSSFLESLGRAVVILALQHLEPAPAVKNEVVTAVRPYKRPEGGFSHTPINTPNYLDEIHRGLSIIRAVNERPRYPRETAQFIGQLQNANGGFRRAADPGISRLENAFYALNALLEFTRWDI
jgi:hypothetical protein